MVKESPRIEDGVIKWYCGDAFYISFEVLDDETGAPLKMSDSDSITISFFNRQNVCVKQFVFGSDCDCSVLDCHIDEAVTKQFAVGVYTYCIKYHQGSVGTIATVKAVGKCEVERCH